MRKKRKKKRSEKKNSNVFELDNPSFAKFVNRVVSNIKRNHKLKKGHRLGTKEVSHLATRLWGSSPNNEPIEQDRGCVGCVLVVVCCLVV